MATTRTPLQPAPAILACHAVGFDTYIVRYREGQEDLARESIARWVRNPDLAFSWTDAAVMGEQIPYEPTPEDCGYYLPPVEVIEPSPFWDWAAACLRVGAVTAPWVLLLLLGRFAWGKWGM